jgi:hypothetical protein
MVPLLLVVAPAFAACDDPIFAVIAPPAPDASGHGVATGAGTMDGKDVVGGRFSLTSAQPLAAWKDVLAHAENQDEWVPRRFGYEDARLLDGDHMYLRFDIGLIMDSVHIQRQLVVQLASGMAGDAYRTCWRMIDPSPWMSRLQGIVAEGVDWERASTGWWEATPLPGGGTLVNYQWWTEVGRIPAVLQRFGMSHTLPDLLDAFEVRVAAMGAR